VAGKLAGLEIAVRNLANATKETSFSQAMAGHARSYQDDLSDINSAVPLPEVAEVLKEFRKVRFKLRANQKDLLQPFAEMVFRTGMEFAKMHDGSKLGGLDENQLIPTVRMGTRYKPAE